MINRQRIRRTVCAELRQVRSYRQALRTPELIPADRREYMRTWVRVADDMLASIREDGEDRAGFVDALYGITRRPIGSGRYVFNVCMHKYHMSTAGLERWRDNAVFIASILAVVYGAIDLSDDERTWQNIEFEHGQKPKQKNNPTA